ncbi:unnamed protein product [Penicillium crustosum]
MQNWVIGKQLSEHIHRFTNHKIGEGLGSSFAARKFTCHIENGTETGIMRIHLHVPNLRTEFHNSAHRAVQTAKSPGHAEIAAFKTLQSAQSHVAPRLLALREDAQGNDGLIPVPGKPITKEEFWGLHPSLRDTIRGKFKVLYRLVYILHPYTQRNDSYSNQEQVNSAITGLRSALLA